MNLALLPPKNKIKIDSGTLQIVSEIEKSFAQLDVLTKFIRNDFFSLLKTLEAINNYNIDSSPKILSEQYFLNPNEFEIINNQVAALETALKILKDVKPIRLLKTLHQEICANENNSAGVIRDDGPANEIKISAPQNVSELLNNFETYLLGEHIYHPFINAAIIHAQFELIHPFKIYNGIVGRCLTQVNFVWKKRLSKPILILSQVLFERKNEYFEKLNDVAIKENWNDWIRFMLETFLQSSKESIVFLETLNSYCNDAISKSINNNFASPALLKVVEFASVNPIFTIPNLTSSLGISKQTASVAINKLLAENILTESSGKQRYRTFKNEKLSAVISL